MKRRRRGEWFNVWVTGPPTPRRSHGLHKYITLQVDSHSKFHWLLYMAADCLFRRKSWYGGERLVARPQCGQNFVSRSFYFGSSSTSRPISTTTPQPSSRRLFVAKQRRSEVYRLLLNILHHLLHIGSRTPYKNTKVDKMNYECNPKKLTRGFPGSPPSPIFKPNDWSFMKPEYPPLPGTAYELTATACLGPSYWKSKEREGLKAKAGVKTTTPSPWSAVAIIAPADIVTPVLRKLSTTDNTTDWERKLSEAHQKAALREERHADIARAHSQQKKIKKENVRPRGSMFKMEMGGDESYTGGVLTDLDKETLDEFADRTWSAGVNGRRLNHVILNDKRDESKRIAGGAADDSDFATAYTRRWVKDVGKIGPCESAANSSSMEARIRADTLDDTISFVCLTPDSDIGSKFVNTNTNPNAAEKNTSMKTTEEATGYAKATPYYTGAPGDHSALNSRAGRSAADLEFAMHRTVFRSDDAQDHDYPLEVYPSSHEFNLNNCYETGESRTALKELNEKEEACELARVLNKPKEDPLKIKEGFSSSQANY